MVELHLLEAEGQGEENAAGQVASGDGRYHCPESKAQANAVVLKVTMVYEKQARS